MIDGAAQDQAAGPGGVRGDVEMDVHMVVVGGPCPRCGRAGDADARFCGGCGLDLATIAATPPPPPPTPIAPPPPSTVAAQPPPDAAPGIRAAGPPVEPSAIGRRASPLGWIAVVLGAGAFLAVSFGVISLAGNERDVAVGPGAAPLARFDRTLYDGATVTPGEPFEIEVEAVNPAATATAPLWMVIEWRPEDLAATPGASGAFVACDPAGCASTDERGPGRTIVSWPGLPPGGRQVLRATVVVDDLVADTTFRYRVLTGSGETEAAVDGGYTWDLELEVE